MKIIPKNTKLPATISDNYLSINDRLNWLWKLSKDSFEFYTNDEIQNKLNIFIDELNSSKNGYYIEIGKNKEYLLTTNNISFDVSLLRKTANNNNIELKLRTIKGNKFFELKFARNYLKEKAHNIKPNSEKICNIYFQKRGNYELYFIRFDRWVDTDVFNYVNTSGKIILNKIGEKIKIIKSGDFSSANEVFIASDESLKIAIETLQQKGYTVGVKNYL